MKNKKEELVTVIVPIYNVEKHLRKCLDSIINQSYKNLEIILVDDGSTDDSSNISEAYKNIDKRIIVIHKENGGAADARNYGLDVAKGQYITFIDSDDFINEKMIEDFYNVIKKNNCDIVFGNSYDYSLDNLTEEEINFDISKVRFYNRKDCLAHINANLYNVLYPKLYKSFIFDDLRFPKGLICEDSYIAPYIYDKIEKIAILPYYYYYRLIRKDSVVHKKFNEKDYGLIKVGEARVEYYRNREKEQIILSYQFLMSNIIDLYKKAYVGYAQKKEKDNILKKYKEVYLTIKKELDLKEKLKYVSFLMFPNLVIKILLRKDIVA